MEASPPTVGIIANPISARDIRRVIANATSLQIADRANIVLRVLACLHFFGVKHVLMMPENGGIRGHVARNLQQATNRGEARFPEISYLDMPVTAGTEDSQVAARLMDQAGVSLIVVLGGDGTHRAVVAHCGDTPIAGVSTGTNNAFPEHREATITGLAAGLMASGLVPIETALAPNKLLEVEVGQEREIALVDVAVVAERYIGARALWRTENFKELFVTFADPQVIGMSSIAGLIDPVDRLTPEGRRVRFAPSDTAPHTICAPIAPGLMSQVGLMDWGRLMPDETVHVASGAGSLALDGERELSFSEQAKPQVTLRTNAFRTVDVPGCMHYAAKNGLFRDAAAFELQQN